jgi:hypothetical protein
MAAYGRAWAYRQVRSAVEREISRQAAACPSVRPPKKRSSTSLALLK